MKIKILFQEKRSTISKEGLWAADETDIDQAHHRAYGA